MFLPVKAILDRRTRKDGTAAIYIQYCFSSDRRILLSTDLGVPPAHWNKRLLRVSPSLPTGFGDAEALNGKLQKMLRTVEDMISYSLEQKMADPIAFLKKAWHPEFKAAELSEKAREIEAADAPEENLDFFHQFDAYIKAKIRKVSPGMLRTYYVVKQRLIDFQKHRRSKITFDSFDYNFYESLVNYLTYDHIHHRRQTVLRGLKRNSIGTTIKQLRIFCGTAHAGRSFLPLTWRTSKYSTNRRTPSI